MLTLRPVNYFALSSSTTPPHTQLSSSIAHGGEVRLSASSSLFMGGPLTSPRLSSIHGLRVTRRFLTHLKRISGLEEAIRIKKERERELRASPTAKRRPPLRRGKVSQRFLVLDHIPRPPYVSLDLMPDISSEHQIHDSEGIAKMRAACELAARVQDYAGTLVRLSKNRKVYVRTWQGKVVVDIREFYYKDGKEFPGKKGKTLFFYLHSV